MPDVEIELLHCEYAAVCTRPGAALDLALREALLNAQYDLSTAACLAEEIIKAAIDFNTDVIVMATRGRKGLSHLLIGSVTEGVLRKTVCPVLAIRPAASPKP